MVDSFYLTRNCSIGVFKHTSLIFILFFKTHAYIHLDKVSYNATETITKLSISVETSKDKQSGVINAEVEYLLDLASQQFRIKIFQQSQTETTLEWFSKQELTCVVLPTEFLIQCMFAQFSRTLQAHQITNFHARFPRILSTK